MKRKKFVKALVENSSGGRGVRGREERPKYVGPEPVEGEVYGGIIKGIHQFGVFLEFMPGAEDGSTPGLEGLCHISELAKDRVRNCEGFVKGMNTEEFNVVYMGLNKSGKRQLSRKEALGKKVGDNRLAEQKQNKNHRQSN